MHRIPFDTRMVLHRHPPGGDDGGYGLVEIFQAAADLGFRTGTTRVEAIDDFAALTLPCLVFAKPVPSAAEPEEPASESLADWASPVLIAGSDSNGILYFEVGAELPKTCARDEFTDRFDSIIHLFARQPEAVRDEDGAKALGEKPFGFAWFVPEILKHRNVWRDILAASLALRLVGLATPLFTQVVIDKVVVHQTESTLIVVGVGLALSILFSAIFSCNRHNTVKTA